MPRPESRSVDSGTAIETAPLLPTSPWVPSKTIIHLGRVPDLSCVFKLYIDIYAALLKHVSSFSHWYELVSSSVFWQDSSEIVLLSSNHTRHLYMFLFACFLQCCLRIVRPSTRASWTPTCIYWEKTQHVLPMCASHSSLTSKSPLASCKYIWHNLLH